MAKRASEKAAKRRLQFDSSTEEEFADNSSGESSEPEEVTDTSGVLKIISLKILVIFIIYFLILFIFGKL